MNLLDTSLILLNAKGTVKKAADERDTPELLDLRIWSLGFSHFSPERFYLGRCHQCPGQAFGGNSEAWSIWINTYLILCFKDIDSNFIIKLIASFKFVYSPQTHTFLAGEGGTGSMTWSLNHSLSVLSITLVSFPCFWPALFLDQTLAGWEVIRTRWT